MERDRPPIFLTLFMGHFLNTTSTVSSKMNGRTPMQS